MAQHTRMKWKIIRLHEHPQQEALFGDISDAELQALADKIEREGFTDPIEVLPDGTIIAGHQRLRAVQLLGWTEVDVIIRRDLAAAGPAAVERYFIEDNLVRRHLSPLGRARCIQRLLEIEIGRNAKGFSHTQKEALKNQIAERMGLSLRSVNRYLRLLQTPPAVQQAFDQGKLTIIQAGKVADFSQITQQRIAAKIEEGEEAQQVIAAFLNHKTSANGQDTASSFSRLLRALTLELPAIEGRASEVQRGKVQQQLATLKAARRVLWEWITYAEHDEEE